MTIEVCFVFPLDKVSDSDSASAAMAHYDENAGRFLQYPGLNGCIKLCFTRSVIYSNADSATENAE